MSDLPVSRLPRLRDWAYLFSFVAVIAPAILSYAPVHLYWDEAFYAHRVICMTREFFAFNSGGMANCLQGSHKGPVITLTGLLWGPAGATELGVGFSLAGLGLVTFVLALATYRVCLQAGIPPWRLTLAGAAIGLAPLARDNAGAFMTDSLVAWCSALLMMLIAREFSAEDGGAWASFWRGAVWSSVIMLGGLSKMTFAFFAAAAAPILVYARWRRCGIKAIGWAALGGAVFAIPGLLIWMLCGRAMIEFGVRFAFGEAAALWSVPGMGAARYLTRFLGSLDLALFPIAILALLFARGVWKEKARLIPVGIVLGYLLVAAMGQNHEPRYTLTVAVSLPLVLSWHGIARRPKPRLDAAPFLGAAFVALLLSVPMIARPQLAAVRHDLELLRGFSHGQPTSFLIATDGPDNNIEVLQLARQIGGRQLLPVYVDTLVYDAINKRSLNDGYTRMAAADYVLFLRPHLPPGPPWSRQWASEYRAYAEETGALIPFPECPDFDVFRMKPR